MDAKPLELDINSDFSGKSVIVSGQLFSEAERYIYYCTNRFLAQEKESSAIWISTDTPYEKVKENFSSFGFPLEQGAKGKRGTLHLLDLISYKAGVTRKKCDDCRYIQDPSNLTELSLAIKDILSNNKCGLLVIDSLNSLLVYNDLTKTLQFLRFLSASAYEKKMALLVYLVSGERDPRAETSIKMAFDAVILFEQDHVFLQSGTSQKSFRFDFSDGKLKLSRA
ncbi:MAG: ATPase domain-containing protein [Candidatus Micrarchaeota archaeon]